MMDDKNLQNNLNEALEEVVEEVKETEILEETAEETKEADQKPEKIKSAYRLKYGTLSVSITALFIAVIVLLNVVFGILGENYPLSIDMTTESAYTVNPENIEFLKTIKYPVKLKVLFTEDQYKEGSYPAYYKNITDNSDGKYYAQTVKLLKEYKKYNSNISVEFLDPYSSEISVIIQEFMAEDISIDYGDILIEAYPNGEDLEPERGVIAFNDCYELESEESSSYYGTDTQSYTLAGNKVENAVANGIFKTVNLETVKAGILTVGSSDAYVENFKTTAEDNAITFENISVIDAETISKFSTLFILAPSADYSEKEVKTLSNWLDNDGKKGRSLYFFASAASPKLPNISSLLEEWGIEVQTGYKYYSNADRYYSTNNTNIYLETAYSDYTSAIDSLGYNYIADNMVPLKTVYESEPGGTRTVTEVLTTSDTATYKKPDNDPSWKAKGGGSTGSAILLSKDENEGEKSFVVAVSSVDFLTNNDTLTKTDNGNFKYLVTLINSTSRDSADKYVMETKVLGDSSSQFTSSTNNLQSVIIGIIFIGIIPLSLIALAIYVYIKRKNY